MLINKQTLLDDANRIQFGGFSARLPSLYVKGAHSG